MEVTCEHCNQPYQIEDKEYKRKTRLGTKFFCSLSHYHLHLKKSAINCLECGKPLTGNSRKFCDNACHNKYRYRDPEFKKGVSDKLKKLYVDHPEKFVEFKKEHGNIIDKTRNHRFSSKIERKLAELLEPLGFRRHRTADHNDIRLDFDIYNDDLNIYIESDGDYHFRKVHKHHNYERTLLMDSLKEDYCLIHGIILIRFDNRIININDQVRIVKSHIGGQPGIYKYYETSNILS